MFFSAAKTSEVVVPSADRSTHARLCAAIEHLLGLQRQWATGCGDVAARAAVRGLEQELGIASQPEEIVAVAKGVMTLAAPDSPTAAGGMSPALAARLAEGIAEVARRLDIGVVQDDARELARQDKGDPDAVVALVRRLAEAVGEVRRAQAVLDNGLDDVASRLSELRVADQQSAAQASAVQARIAQVADREDLAAAREALSLEAKRMEDATNQRVALLAQLEHQAREVQTRAAQMMEELADAASAARTDTLTGLGNRRALEDAVAAAASDSRSFGVVAIDIDFFKKVNDTQGHAGGDLVLQHVAKILATELRGEDKAFRSGGEEFVALLANCDVSGAARTAERVRSRIESMPAKLSSGALRVPASFGVATWAGGGSFEDALERADKALYKSQEGGRNRVSRG